MNTNPLDAPDTKAYFAWKEMTRFRDDRTPEVKLGWDAACEYKNKELADMQTQLAAIRSAGKKLHEKLRLWQHMDQWDFEDDAAISAWDTVTKSQP